MTKAIKIETKNMIRKLRSVENSTLKQTFRYCWSLISIFWISCINFVVGIYFSRFFWQSNTHKHTDQSLVRTFYQVKRIKNFCRIYLSHHTYSWVDIEPFFKCINEMCNSISSEIKWLLDWIYRMIQSVEMCFTFSIRCQYKYTSLYLNDANLYILKFKIIFCMR